MNLIRSFYKRNSDTIGLNAFIIGIVVIVVGFAVYVESLPCAEGFEIGDVVTHVTDDTKGVIHACRPSGAIVNTSNNNYTWKWEHLVEFRERNQ